LGRIHGSAVVDIAICGAYALAVAVSVTFAVDLTFAVPLTVALALILGFTIISIALNIEEDFAWKVGRRSWDGVCDDFDGSEVVVKVVEVVNHHCYCCCYQMSGIRVVGGVVVRLFWLG
jgi:hypothetical protein